MLKKVKKIEMETFSSKIKKIPYILGNWTFTAQTQKLKKPALKKFLYLPCMYVKGLQIFPSIIAGVQIIFVDSLKHIWRGLKS